MNTKFTIVGLVSVIIMLSGCAAPQPMPVPSNQSKPSPNLEPQATATVIVPSQLPATPTLSAAASAPMPVVTQASNMVLIPAGQFERGDHHDFVDPGHGSDEIPIRTISISTFYIARYDVTVQQYCDFLNSALSQKLINVGAGSYHVSGGPRGEIQVTGGIVFLNGIKDNLYVTRQAYNHSPINWDGVKFTVLENRENHPVTGLTWYGAAAYCNWLSQREGYQPCYDTFGWGCYYNRNGYRLPTEAEWEYAGRGGQYNPYYNYPWGNEAEKTRANWPNSGDPYENWTIPHTTPVGFYDGQLKKKTDFNWPGSMETYQTGNGANVWGLYDMAGNVWQWVNDWYQTQYYTSCPSKDPPGPEMSDASPMPDGWLYRCLRGGNWYNGEADKFMPSVDNGHSRVSNRDPAYYLGQEEYEYSEVGFRVARRDAMAAANEMPYGQEKSQPAWHAPTGGQGQGPQPGGPPNRSTAPNPLPKN
jgi:formylglycine-generating enzyme required for sulfatase activity